MKKNNIGRPLSVYIIESPSKTDILFNNMESNCLFEFLNLCNIPSKKRTVKNYNSFYETITDGFNAFCLESRRIPVIHMSLHGCREGIVLTDNQITCWEDLARLLEPLNELACGNLVLYLSACRSIFAQDMVSGNKRPFSLLVCNHGVIGFREAILASNTFYYHLSSGSDIGQISEAIKIVTGNGFFEILSIEQIVKLKNLLAGFKEMMAKKRLRVPPG